MLAWTVEANEIGSSWEDVLVTDRPDAAEASDTVERGRWQVETSVGFSSDESPGITTRSLSFPTLLRYGVME